MSTVKTIHKVLIADEYGEYTKTYSTHRTKSSALKSLKEARNYALDVTYMAFSK